MNYFRDINEPSMNELIIWFMKEYPTLTDEMHNANHAVCTDEPNPYHIEGSILTHTMMVCQRAEISSEENYNKISLITALLHDVGKPMSLTVIPFEAKKPVHTESNKIRNNDDNDKQVRDIPNSGLKKHMRGHEGISFHLSVELVNDLEKRGVLTKEEKQEVLSVVSLHGTLFDSIKDGEEYKAEKVISKFNNIDSYRNYVLQVKNDSLGRFFSSKDGRKNQANYLGKSIYNDDTYHKYNKDIITKDGPSITVLIGIPGVGKSTYLSNRVAESSPEIVSRDTILEEFGKEKYGDLNYSEIWGKLDDGDQKEIDSLLQEKFINAKRNNKDIIVDMTNVSAKARRKWLSNVPKNYSKKAVVFATEYKEIMNRLEKREKETGKSIPEYVIENMMKGFMVPTYNEVEEIEWIF